VSERLKEPIEQVRLGHIVTHAEFFTDGTSQLL
jgi:hypothetical protein